MVKTLTHKEMMQRERDRIEILRRALEVSLEPSLEEYRDDDNYPELLREDAIVRRQIGDYERMLKVWDILIERENKR